MKSVFEDVFSEVKVLTAGSLKHVSKSAVTQNQEKTTFVPIFPYLYRSLRFGDSIADGNGKCDRVKLYLNGSEP